MLRTCFQLLGVGVLVFVLDLGRALGQSAPDPAAAERAFLAASWNAGSETFSRNTGGSGGPADFWWQAHFLETALDALEARGRPEDRTLVDAIVTGFEKTHPGYRALFGVADNAFDDDLGWWALALTRAFEVTGEARFRDRARTLFESISAFEDPTYGGGIWWRRDGVAPQGMCANAPYVETAVRLARITGERAYLDKARAVHAWIESRLVEPDGTCLDRVEGEGSGVAHGRDLTYGYGTYIGACVALADATGDPTYLEHATHAADRVLAKWTTLPDEGDGDGSGFKMILARHLASLARVVGEPERGRIQDFLDANARAAWEHRNQRDLMGDDWTTLAPEVVTSFAAASGVDTLWAAELAHQPLAPAVPLAFAGAPPLVADLLAQDRALDPSALPGVTFDDAAKARLHGLSLESAHEDVPGASHIAGWNADGEWADFHIATVVHGGLYTLGIRYSAGAGDATRYVYANGHGVVDALAFPGTKSWDDARMVSVARLELEAGDNVISLIYDSSRGSRNDLNVDRISVAVAPGGLKAAHVSLGTLFDEGLDYLEGLK